jgi:CHAT domain-containing protein
MQALTRGGRIAPLPGTKIEAETVRSAFPDSVVYTGNKVQESVVKAEAGKFRYLHFATHGFLNDASPMLSTIVMAAPSKGSKEDGFLTAREIAEMRLNADMTVLSACNTGRGRARTGEGVVGLTWALFVAGCPTQIVSQWSVHDTATAQLMSRFYRNLQAGQGKADSLRQAALSLRKQKAFAHPYYWSPFVLVGGWR